MYTTIMRNNIFMLPPLLLAAVVFDSARIVAGSHRRLNHEEKITDTGKSDSLRYYKQRKRLTNVLPLAHAVK